MRKFAILGIVSLVFFAGCGGSASQRFNTAITVSITPATATVQAGGTLQLIATVANDPSNKGITWALSGTGCIGADCGTLSSATSNLVIYTAPGPPASDRAVTITATSAADTTKSGSATITVPAVIVSVTPAPATVLAGNSQSFTATVQNVSNVGVTWTLSGTGCTGADCGTLSSTTSNPVTYTAPANLPPGNLMVTITATSVADSTKSSSATITALSACETGGERALQGRYSLMLKGVADSSGNPALLGGVLTFDGNGLITAGEIDLNLPGGFDTANGGNPLPVASGSTYSVHDNRGCMTIVTSAGTMHFRFTVGNFTIVALTAHVISFDTTGPFVSGIMRWQASGSWSNGQIVNTLAFGGSSIQNAAVCNAGGSPNCGGKFAVAGVLTLDGKGGITGGAEDTNQNGFLDGTTGLTSWPATSPISVANTSTYSIAPDGRGTITLNFGGLGGSMTAILYMAYSNEAFFMSSNSQTTGPIVAGEALGILQQPSLSGNYVEYDSGLSTATAGGTAGEIALVTIANSTITGSAINNNGGVISSVPISGNITVASNGRAVVSSAGQADLPVLYISSSFRSFVLFADAKVSSGFAEPQSSGPFTDSSPNGMYAGGSIDVASINANVSSIEATFTPTPAPAMLGVIQDKNAAGTLTVRETQSFAYSVDSTGLGLFPAGCTIGSTTNVCQVAFYVILPSILQQLPSRIAAIDINPGTSTNPRAHPTVTRLDQ